VKPSTGSDKPPPKPSGSMPTFLGPGF
jgi:hypothetical protein